MVILNTWMLQEIMYIEKKKANVITTEMEDKLWEQGLLGNNSPQVFQVCWSLWLDFALL